MSQSPELQGGISPVAFDRDGLRLSVEPEFQSKPQTPIPSHSQEAFPSVEAPRSSLAVLIIKPHAVKQRHVVSLCLSWRNIADRITQAEN